MTRLALLFIALTVTLSACGPNVIYDQDHPTGNEGWAYADSLRFDYTIPSTEVAYDMLLKVQHSTAFPYENFYLNIHTELPNGQRSTERVSLDLSGNFGAWNGNCSGTACQLAIPILQQTRFEQAGDYSIILEQNSRDNPLPAISAMGLRIEESSPRAN